MTLDLPLITDPAFYAAAIPAVLLMGLAKSGLGGFGALATPLMALAVPVPQAAAIMLPLLFVMDVIGLQQLWREADRPLLEPEAEGKLLRGGLQHFQGGVGDFRPDAVAGEDEQFHGPVG